MTLPRPAGHTVPDTSQDAIGLLGHLGTLLAHVQLAVDQHPQVLFCWAAFLKLSPGEHRLDWPPAGFNSVHHHSLGMLACGHVGSLNETECQLFSPRWMLCKQNFIKEFVYCFFV